MKSVTVCLPVLLSQRSTGSLYRAKPTLPRLDSVASFLVSSISPSAFINASGTRVMYASLNLEKLKEIDIAGVSSNIKKKGSCWSF